MPIECRCYRKGEGQEICGGPRPAWVRLGFATAATDAVKGLYAETIVTGRCAIEKTSANTEPVTAAAVPG